MNVSPAVRHFSQSQSIMQGIFGKSTMPAVPLNLPFPSSASATPVSEFKNTEAVKITTLPSGIRVASNDSGFPSSSVGLFVDAGSRNDSVAGLSNFVGSMLVKSTPNRSEFRLFREMSKLGAKLNVTQSREHTQVTTDCLREHVPHIVGSFADLVKNPLLDVTEIRESAAHLSSLQSENDKNLESLTSENLHWAAFNGETLGLPLRASSKQAKSITKENLSAYYQSLITPDRIIVAASGYDHSELVKLVQNYFDKMASPSKNGTVAANYTGGDIRVTSADGDEASHLALGFAAPSWQSQDLVASCMLQMIMGGGGSFSAGGPGKGMCSRVYETVLNVHGFVDQANCFSNIYTDSAIFGMYGSCQSEYIGDLTKVFVSTLKSMAGPFRAGELARARNQLKGNLSMQLESRSVQLEDMGRQILAYKKVKTVAEVHKEIDQVTEGDIQRVARQMLAKPLTVSAYGNLLRLPTYDKIASQFRN